jgi:hypothetical protein
MVTCPCGAELPLNEVEAYYEEHKADFDTLMAVLGAEDTSYRIRMGITENTDTPNFYPRYPGQREGSTVTYCFLPSYLWSVYHERCLKMACQAITKLNHCLREINIVQ